MTADLSILMPTLRRPESLARTVRSVLAQEGVDHLRRELVVVDNSPEGSAQEVVAGLAEGAPFPVRYVHEPRPGVATARNSGLAAASGALIAFLDDDEEAHPGWLAALLAAHAEHGADVTFGAIRGRAPEGTGWAREYLESLFSRVGPTRSGVVAKPWGCGNSLHTRATALAGPGPFNTAMDQVGGEDDVLFSGLIDQGRRFAWAPDAWVWEHPAPHRATLTHALQRAFTYGQGPSQTAAFRRDRLAVAKWMAIGAGQTVVYGAAAAALWLVGHPRRAHMLDRTAQGLGKVLWMPWFEFRFYGAAEVARTDAAA